MIKSTIEGHISKNPKNLPSRSMNSAFLTDNAVASTHWQYTQVEYAWEIWLGLVVWGGGGVENGVWVGRAVCGCGCVKIVEKHLFRTFRVLHPAYTTKYFLRSKLPN